MNDKTTIMALGLNPAWQKTLFFSELRRGNVNRAGRMTLMASGKGINFCRAAAAWQQSSLLLHFLGGRNGADIAAELRRENITAINIDTAAETRMCTTCLCAASGEMTELIEPSGMISEHELRQLQAAIADHLPACGGLALCGTYPPGIDATLYRDAAVAAGKLGIPVMLDSWKEVVPTLEAGVSWLKINREELLAMTGSGTLEYGLRWCFERYRIGFAAITDGPGTACLSDGKSLWRYELPYLPRVGNPIGAGDTCTAVTFTEFLRGTAPSEAFALGLAAASASCLTEAAAVFSVAEALALRQGIKIAIDSLK